MNPQNKSMRPGNKNKALIEQRKQFKSKPSVEEFEDDSLNGTNDNYPDDVMAEYLEEVADALDDMGNQIGVHAKILMNILEALSQRLDVNRVPLAEVEDLEIIINAQNTIISQLLQSNTLSASIRQEIGALLSDLPAWNDMMLAKKRIQARHKTSNMIHNVANLSNGADEGSEDSL